MQLRRSRYSKDFGLCVLLKLELYYKDLKPITNCRAVLPTSEALLPRFRDVELKDLRPFIFQ